jgi:hypothetical protein
MLARAAAVKSQAEKLIRSSMLEAIRRFCLSWEAILRALPVTAETDALRGFYAECIRFNPIRARGTATDHDVPLASTVV